jgi:hypothetical protein
MKIKFELTGGIFNRQSIIKEGILIGTYGHLDCFYKVLCENKIIDLTTSEILEIDGLKIQ